MLKTRQLLLWAAVICYAAGTGCSQSTNDQPLLLGSKTAQPSGTTTNSMPSAFSSTEPSFAVLDLLAGPQIRPIPEEFTVRKARIQIRVTSSKPLPGDGVLPEIHRWRVGFDLLQKDGSALDALANDKAFVVHSPSRFFDGLDVGIGPDGAVGKIFDIEVYANPAGKQAVFIGQGGLYKPCDQILKEQ